MEFTGSSLLLTFLSIFICIMMIAAVIFKPKLTVKYITVDTYWIIALIGAIILLIFGFISPQSLLDGLTAETAVNPLKILVLFLSMTFLSLYLDELGFFRYLAGKTLKWAHDSQYRMFFAFYTIISVLTIFTSNDVIILTFTPFICYFAKYAGVNPIPYLVTEFVAANTWSMVLLIGNPTNIYLASSFNIGFMEYLSVMIIPAIGGAMLGLLILFLLFHSHLKSPLTQNPVDIFVLSDKIAVTIGIIHLTACVVLLAVSSYLGIEMWAVSLGCACSLAVCTFIRSLFQNRLPKELGHAVKRVPWSFIPFILAMFTIVLSLSQANITAGIAETFNGGNPVFTYGISSCLAANMVNNIPMSVLFSGILSSTPISSDFAGVYAAIIGSNIGAFVTPIGALAGIMWINILRSKGIPFSFIQFIKYGTIVALPVLMTTLGLLVLVLD